MRTDDEAGPPAAVELTLAGPAAGGACVAHRDDATWFVRGGLPGERVMARQTGAKGRGRIRFADVVEVLTPSADRVVPPCPAAGRCGGCDLQHVAYGAQLRWKSQVLADQLQRIGRISTIGSVPVHEAVVVEAVPLPGRPDGLGWRTRLALSTDEAGRPCFHGRHSDELVAVPGCVVTVPELQAGFAGRWAPGRRLAWALGEQGAVVDGEPAGSAAPVAVPGWTVGPTVVRQAAGRSWLGAVGGFWQAHAAAPDVLVDAVRRALAPASGDSVIDLYCGVGLFAGALGAEVGEGGSALAVEGDRRAARLARRNLADLPQARVVQADVQRWVAKGGSRALATADVVVLDPPRAGAGAAVVSAVAAAGRARAVAYVACDGGSLARDAAMLGQHGWELSGLRAFDLFGMSHHVEAVATFRRS